MTKCSIEIVLLGQKMDVNLGVTFIGGIQIVIRNHDDLYDLIKGFINLII